MTNDKRPVLVFGATGRQGGSVASALLKAGHPVRALVLDALEPRATALRDAGVEVVTGSFEDRPSIRAAMQNTYGVFSVLPAGFAAGDEVRHGISIANLAVESGVEHFIYSSGASVGDKPTGVERFDAKSRIEAHVRALPFIATIVRPMIFMEMLVRPGLGLDQGRLLSLIHPEQSIHLTAVKDIGKFVAAMFGDRTQFGGMTLKIASDRVTGRDIEAALTEAAGYPIFYGRLPDDVLAASADLAHMARSLLDGPLAEHVDLEAMRRINPEILSFRLWLGTCGRKAFEEALGRDAA
nr:NmrA/HSCARG family protein [Rhizobium sp. Q54]